MSPFLLLGGPSQGAPTSSLGHDTGTLALKHPKCFSIEELYIETLRFFPSGFVLQDAEAEQGVVGSAEDPRILHVYVETLAQL